MSRPPTILVVDDHKEIRELVAKHLIQNGLQAVVADGALEMRRVLRRTTVDLVVLDIMMPGEDGLTLCRELRQTSDMPVILLTARVEEADKIVGLELGADDYLTKPFSPRELLARIRTVLRRSGDAPRSADHQPKRYRFEGHILDVGKRLLLRDDGGETLLSTAEFNLLLTFVRRPNVTLSREQLLAITAGRTAQLFDRSIDNLVTRLRRQIETDAKRPTLIKTVWGQGYAFSSDVEVIP